MGIIYIISSSATAKEYIGQTTQPLEQRWYEHHQAAQRYVKYIDTDPEAIKSIRFSILYRAMAKYGFETFSIEAVMEAPDEELNDLEIECIEGFGTLAPNGYNLASGGGNFKHSPKTIELMKERKRANVEKNRHEKLRGMPMYVSYYPPSRGEAIRVVNHPLCNDIVFSVHKYGSFENAKTAVLEFLAELEASGVSRRTTKMAGPKPKKPLTAPKIPPALVYPTPDKHPGIIKTKYGYRVQKKYKGIRYFKNFENRQYSMEENKAAAIEWLAQIIDKLIQEWNDTQSQKNVQRLDVGGSDDVGDDEINRMINDAVNDIAGLKI